MAPLRSHRDASAASGGRCRSSPPSLDRLRLAGQPLLRGGVRPRRASPGLRGRRGRAGPAHRARSSARASAPSWSPATRGSSCASSACCRSSPPGCFAGFALSPWLWLGVVVQRGRHRACSPPSARASTPRWPWRSRPGLGRSGSASVAVGAARPAHPADHRRARRTAGASATAMLLMLPVFVVGGLIISSAGRVIVRDITQVWTTAAARSEVAYERRQGRSKLLLVRDLDVSYGRRAGALRREPRGRRGRDHRPARHQRRRQVDAAAGRSPGSSRPTAAPSSSTAST